jgi:hypothetical protein
MRQILTSMAARIAARWDGEWANTLSRVGNGLAKKPGRIFERGQPTGG